MRADIETVLRLEHLFSLGERYRQQIGESESEEAAVAAHEHLEAVAHECCELMGFAPEYDDFYAETAKEIVMFGRDVCEAIEAINERILDQAQAQEQPAAEASNGD